MTAASVYFKEYLNCMQCYIIIIIIIMGDKDL